MVLASPAGLHLLQFSLKLLFQESLRNDILQLLRVFLLVIVAQKCISPGKRRTGSTLAETTIHADSVFVLLCASVNDLRRPGGFWSRGRLATKEIELTTRSCMAPSMTFAPKTTFAKSITALPPECNMNEAATRVSIICRFVASGTSGDMAFAIFMDDEMICRMLLGKVLRKPRIPPSTFKLYALLSDVAMGPFSSTTLNYGFELRLTRSTELLVTQS